MREPCKPITEKVTLPELGEVYVQSIGMRERADLAKKLEKVSNAFDPALIMFEKMIVEKDGQQVWDADSWSVWSGKYLDDFQRLSALVAQYAGYGVEEAKKN